MLQNVSVRHVRISLACRIGEAHQDLGHAPGRNRGDILPSRTVGLRRFAIYRNDPKLTAVNVHRVQHAIAALRYSPAERLVTGGSEVDSVERERLSVHAICRET